MARTLLGRRRSASLGTTLSFAFALACDPIEHVVFDPELPLELPAGPIRIQEGSGLFNVPVRLSRARAETTTATYEIIGLEAQDGCHEPDFQGPAGKLEWSPGSLQANIELFIDDDDLAETDERLLVSVRATGARSSVRQELTIVIEDDDRSALLDAREFGAEPGSAGDQSRAIQSALDRARELGRGVVVIPEGDYVVLGVQLFAGTTISASGARFQRPPDSGAEAITLSVEHSGQDDSDPTLIEGLGIDGQRERQGPFRDFELQDAHLIQLSGASDGTGRLQVSIENLTLANGTANGLSFGPNSDATICRLETSELWRDAVSLRGGQSRIRLRELDAISSEGTTGLFLGPTPDPSGRPGPGNGFIEAELEDVRLGSGDVEIEAYQGSRVTVRRLTMTRPPFRLVAPDATVRIADSVLQIGVSSGRYNYWTVPHDVQVTGSTLVVSETVGDETGTVEEDRTLSAASVRWQGEPGDPSPMADSGHQLTFEGCRFELGRDLEPADSVYAASSSVNGGAIVIRSSTLGSGMRGWFAPECEGCVLTP